MSESRSLPHLFSPIKVGSMRLKNRVVMAPMVTRLASESGGTTQRMLDYYEERARGGVGLIIVEAVYVNPSGRWSDRILGLDRDGVVADHFELAEVMHRHGAKVAVQLNHGGANAKPACCGGTPLAPSPLAGPRYGVIPRELTVEEIEDLAEDFAQAAARAKRAGYDAVELHGAHGYLIHQFLSPATNMRTDEFGGSFENRLRFAHLMLSTLREAVGPQFPVLFRLSAEGGYGLEEAVEIAAALEQEGADCIHVSIGGTAPTSLVPENTSPMAVPEGYLASHSAAITSCVSVPTICVGMIRHPSVGEEILGKGQADLIALGRPFLADPEWPRKAAEGLNDEIRLCIGCDFCRLSQIHDIPIRCLVNPVVGRESDLGELKPTERRKKVVVIGGGPAGMEAAQLAAIRGHDVALYEREENLGGQLPLAAAPPYKERIHWLTENLEAGVRKAGVQLRTSQSCTPATLETEQVEVLIVAAGARPVGLEAQGARSEKVVSSWEVLGGTVEVNEKRVVVLGGRQVGCETAEFLLEKGCAVTVVTRSPATELAEDAIPSYRDSLLGRLRDAGVAFIHGYDAREVKDTSLLLADMDGQTRELPADLIVVARGSAPEDTPSEELRSMVDECYFIGDCVEPRTIAEALYEARLIASRI